MTSPDEMDPVVDELVPRMAELDESLAQGDDSSAHDSAPIAPGLQPRWQRLEACIRLLRQSRGQPTTSAPLPDGIDLELLAGREPTRQFGRFRIVRELGRGGFGIVFLAEDPHLRRLVALKVPRPDALANPDLRARFLREARAAAGLEHPNLVPVYEAGEVGPVCYIVSAYCPGTNLALWLREQCEPVPCSRAAALVAAVAEAVEHAHRHGILHRDLKPANILLGPQPHDAPAFHDGLPFIPRLTDFGLAKLLEAEADDTNTGVILGTPAYMAPEQAEGCLQSVGAPTDVYALGVILYELLTRRLPCRGPSLLQTLEQVRSGQPVPPRRWRPEVPADLETICLKCLHKEPGDRYSSAGELAQDLQRFLRQEPIAARPLGWLARAVRWCRRPERINHAGVIAIFFSLVLFSEFAAGVILILTGSMPVARPDLAVLCFFAGLGGIAVPGFWIGRRTPSRRVHVLWAGLMLPLVLGTIELLIPLGVIDTGGLGGSELVLQLAQLVTVLLLAAGQTVAYSLALVAYYANRHILGFVPEQTIPSP